METELTTEQKLEVIKIAKSKIFNYSNYMCPCISNSIRELGFKINLINPEDYIPEFLKFRPKETYRGSIWFSLDDSGNKKRIEVLDNLIQLLIEKLENEKQRD